MLERVYQTVHLLARNNQQVMGPETVQKLVFLPGMINRMNHVAQEVYWRTEYEIGKSLKMVEPG